MPWTRTQYSAPATRSVTPSVEMETSDGKGSPAERLQPRGVHAVVDVSFSQRSKELQSQAPAANGVTMIL